MGSPDPFTLSFEKGAVKDFGSLDRSNMELIKRALNRLCLNPDAGDVKRVQNVKPAIYRLRVGRMRVFFARSKKARQIKVLAIQLRRETADTYDLTKMRRWAAELPSEFTD